MSVWMIQDPSLNFYFSKLFLEAVTGVETTTGTLKTATTEITTAPTKPATNTVGLEVTAFCSSDHEQQVISGTYIAKGVFGSYIIYEKTVADYNGRWWSLRYDRPSKDPSVDSSTNRWIFMYNDQQVTIGESIFGSNIQNYSNRPG